MDTLALTEITEIHDYITQKLAEEIQQAIKEFHVTGNTVYLSGNVKHNQPLTQDSELTIVVKNGADKVELHIDMVKQCAQVPFLLVDGRIGGVEITNQPTDNWQKAIKTVLSYIA